MKSATNSKRRVTREGIPISNYLRLCGKLGYHNNKWFLRPHYPSCPPESFLIAIANWSCRAMIAKFSLKKYFPPRFRT